jgi:5-methyltetrahydropteroyltriglutamate--homocysteine methyltransferase
MNAARSPEVASRRAMPPTSTISTAPITYVGQADLAADFANLKDALQKEASQGRAPADVFMTAISPNNLEFYHRNGYYPTDEQHLEALANAMNVEYRAIVDAGFVLQIDDPRMATHYNRTPGASIEECRKFIAAHVEAVNLALKGIPRERVRFHTCYSVNVAPRVYDMELRHYLDLMLRINAQAFSFEASNPRHEHEWAVWKEAKLPDDIILIPGVVSHCVHLVEHPELVAQRIERYASIVGRENVLASNDCGFATSAAGDEVHTEVAWAKLEALVEGARLASARLWKRSAAA